MSITDANGYAGRGKMFVLSENQLKMLIPSGLKTDVADLSLLDIGSGVSFILLMIIIVYNGIYRMDLSLSDTPNISNG